MPTTITMPQLGESVTEGTISKWLKREGERIEKYEPLLEVVTDKVNAEVPSPVAGVIQQIIVPEGATVPVGAELAIVEPAATANAVQASPDTTSAVGRSQQDQSPPAVAPAGPNAAESMVGIDTNLVHTRPAKTQEVGTPRRTSPVVRRLAQEYQLDLSNIPGTGLGGRVTKEDVMNYLERQQIQTAEPATAISEEAPTRTEAAVVQPPEPTVPSRDDEEQLQITPMRRQIADHMTKAAQTVPSAWTMMEVDVTGLVKLRESMRDEFRRREGVDLTYLPFFIKATIDGLKEYPILNSSWGKNTIVLKKRINIGVAIALEEGLVVPVIHDADRLSLSAIAQATHDLIDRARSGRLVLGDVQGGTFTVNNTGVFGSVASRPIINTPQAAILTMEAIVKRPVVIDDAIAIRSMMNICISFDHRVTDGLTVGRFLGFVKQRLESAAPGSPIW